MIEEGAQVREGQTILKLPDLANMQVRMTVHESKVDQIEPGMPARITILEQVLSGHVVSIANQPEPGSWFSANVKEYATTVAIDGQTVGLRPGMTASVVVLIDECDDALTVPVSAVVEKRARYYCYVLTSGGVPEEREVIVGISNDSYLQIIDGVLEGDTVLRNPRAVLPEEAHDDTPLEERSTERSDFGERITPTAAPQGRPGSGPGSDGAGSGGGAESQSDLVARLMQNDADGDDKLSRDEIPERARSYIDFDKLDANADGLLDRAEIRSGMSAEGSSPGRGGPGAAGGAGGGGRPAGSAGEST